MTAKTHYAFSFLLVSSLGLPRDLALITSIAALLPDIDHTSSLFGRLFPGIAKPLMARHGHRTITHSLVILLALMLLLLPLVWFYPLIYKGLIVAYFSHIFIDCFNMSGIRLFYPFSQKEYISFRTESLRVKVSSWQEFTIFLVLIFSIVMLSGRTVSVSQAAFSISRMFFKSYSIAYKSYRELSTSYCTAEVTYFNSLMRRKEEIQAPVLAMSADKIILKNKEGRAPSERSRRIVLYSQDITKIKIKSQKQPIVMNHFDSLQDVPFTETTYISGTITYQNYKPNIKDNDFLITAPMPSSLKITVTAITPQECKDLLAIAYDVEEEKEKLKKKLPAYRLQKLQQEEQALENRIAYLSRQGLYQNYNAIEKLTSKLKSTQNKKENLILLREEGVNTAVQTRLKQLEGFSLVTNLYWWEM